MSCGDYEKGGIDAVAILDCDHVITDFTSQTQLQAAIDSGKMKVIKGIRAEIPEASPVESLNPVACGAENITDTYNRMITWADANVSNANITFYNGLKTRQAFILAHHCGDDSDASDDGMLTVIEARLSFKNSRVVPNNQRERQDFKAIGDWTSLDDSPYVSSPPNIFE